MALHHIRAVSCRIFGTVFCHNTDQPTGRAGKPGVPKFSVGNTIMKGVPDHGPNIFGQKSVEAKRKAMTLEQVTTHWFAAVFCSSSSYIARGVVSQDCDSIGRAQIRFIALKSEHLSLKPMFCPIQRRTQFFATVEGKIWFSLFRMVVSLSTLLPFICMFVSFFIYNFIRRGGEEEGGSGQMITIWQMPLKFSIFLECVPKRSHQKIW